MPLPFLLERETEEEGEERRRKDKRESGKVQRRKSVFSYAV